MPAEPRARSLVLTSAFVLANWVVLGIVAATQNWPSEFDTAAEDSPSGAWGWILSGSLIHPPLPPLVFQLVFTAFIFGGARILRAAGAIGLALVGVVYVVGYVGEPLLDPVRSDPPTWLYVLMRIPGFLAVLALIVLGAATARAALRRA